MRVVALGPGDPDLLPVASLEALREAGSVRLDEGAAAFGPSLVAYGIGLDEHSDTVAALDRRALALARSEGAETVPARASLERRAAAQAAVELLELTETLRRECPWDRVQTVESIVPHTLEEAYEVAEAARESGPSAKLIDELGDLLFQTTFLALLCAEHGEGDWTDVADGVAAQADPSSPARLRRRRGGHRRRGARALGPGQGRAGGSRRDLPRRARAPSGAAVRAQGAASCRLGRVRLRRTWRPRSADLESELRELADELAARPEPEAERPADPGSTPSSATSSSRPSTSLAASGQIPSSPSARRPIASAFASSGRKRLPARRARCSPISGPPSRSGTIRPPRPSYAPSTVRLAPPRRTSRPRPRPPEAPA